jgi:hypothetical protein
MGFVVHIFKSPVFILIRVCFLFCSVLFCFAFFLCTLSPVSLNCPFLVAPSNIFLCLFIIYNFCMSCTLPIHLSIKYKLAESQKNVFDG